MALTTVVRGRAYDWSHAIGRGAATGTGFNYIQTMCLGNDGDHLHRQPRQREQFRHAGEPHQAWRRRRRGAGGRVLPARRRRRQGDLAVRRRRRATTATCSARTSGPTRSRCSIPTASSSTSSARPAAATASCCVRLASRSRRTATSSWSTAATTGCRCSSPEGKLVAQCGKAGSGHGEFNQPWGITLDKAGNIYVADWKNHRVQKLSPQGHYLMSIGTYGDAAAIRTTPSP